MFSKKNVSILLILSVVTFIWAVDFATWVNDLHTDESISDEQLYFSLKNRSNYAEPVEKDILIQEFNNISEELQAPFLYFIPPNYQPNEKTPLFVYLHGGVSMPTFIDGYFEQMKESPLLDIARRDNSIMLFPMGNINTVWWSEAGMANIVYQVRFLKEKYNIDDDRVYLSGFSDGASASYNFGMKQPDDFAAFYPINGNMLVGFGATGIPNYTTNLRNRYVRATNSDLDRLYPAEKMRKYVETALKMKANILYKEYWGYGHTYEYGSIDIPMLFEDISRQARNVFQPHLYWETAVSEFGKCDWLEITQIDTLRAKKDWHYHEVMTMSEESIAFGFVDDREANVKGVKISQVIPRSVSAEAGLQEGDIIVAMDGKETDTIEQLLIIRDTKKRGDSFSLNIKRDGKKMKLNGEFPPIEYYKLFDYPEVSGAVEATYFGNHFVIESSRVGEFILYINPEMINPKLPVKVTVNGVEVFEEIIEIDRNYMIENYKITKDRSALWTNKIILTTP
ncbi:MAG: PDZ domain-containing protein [Candidatus Cloacimonadia bacterium]